MRHQQRHGGKQVRARCQPDNVAHLPQVIAKGAKGAADHGVGFAPAQQHGGNQRGVAAQLGARQFRRDTVAAHQRAVFVPGFAIALVAFGVDEVKILPGHQRDAQTLDAPFDDFRAPDQNRARQPFVDDRARGVQHALVLAFGEDDALVFGRDGFGGAEHRLHDDAGMVDEGGKLFDIGGEVFDGARGHARIHRRFGDRRGDAHNQARVEGFRDDVFGAERKFFAAIGGGDFVVLPGAGKLGNGGDTGELHFFGDGGRAHIQRATENEGEAQHVVDLVRVVRTPGGDDAIRTGAFGVFRADFRVRVGERENQRARRHFLHHFGFEHAGRGQPKEHVRAFDDVGQCARIGFLRVAGFGRLHVWLAPFIDDAARIAHVDVAPVNAQGDHQVQAGNRRRARAGADQFDLGNILFHDAQPVEQPGGGDDGGAVLVVVKDGDFHALAQFFFDVKTFRRLDVFQIDAAQRGFERGDDVDEFVRVVLVQFNVEDIDVGEFFEQAALAFHHRLGRQRANVAQPQHCRAVGDHGDQIAA